MQRKKDILIILLSSILFTALFHRQSLGLNLLVFEIGIVTWLFITKRFKWKSKIEITGIISFILTALSTVVNHSVFSYIIHIITFIIFIGIAIYPELKSVTTAINLSINNLVNAQISFVSNICNSKMKGGNIGNYIARLSIFIIPIIIIFIFIAIYRQSNPYFDNLASNIGFYINESLGYLFNDFDSLIIITFLIGIIISSYALIHISNQKVIEQDKNTCNDLTRIKRKYHFNFKKTGLRNEVKSALFLLFSLNIIIFIQNAMDINSVWFNFEWNGQYLKQFVHEGTYLLIFSILISIAVVLYFFRGNINFYSRNKLLKVLSYIWLSQNAILCISVAVRNYRYISYFALAYKRIGVLLFLILTLYGIFSVIIKVRDRKSASYLFNSNTYVLMILLVVFSLFNWDNIIARYNFANYNKSFVHLDYLATLSDKLLPYLDKDLTELKKIDTIQKTKFPFEQKFMTPEEYHKTIELRKKEFIQEWESKSLLSWNLSEYMAYLNLVKQE